MNNVTFEAITIAVNTIVFGVAFSVAMMLMGQVNNVVEFASSKDETISTGNLVETYGDIEERIFTGSELYAFYGQQKTKQTEYEFYVTNETQTLEKYIENSNLNNVLKEEYKLIQKSKNKYIFNIK